MRLVAATDADLESAVAEGRFRAPLLYRLEGYRIRLSPLRERREDFGRLLVEFLRQELLAVGEPERLEADPPWVPAEVVARLALHPWPGNVRQLRNVPRRLAVGCQDSEQAELPPAVEWRSCGPAAGEALSGDGYHGPPSKAPAAAPNTARPRSSGRRAGRRLRASRWNLAVPPAACASLAPPSMPWWSAMGGSAGPVS